MDIDIVKVCIVEESSNVCIFNMLNANHLISPINGLVTVHFLWKRGGEYRLVPAGIANKAYQLRKARPLSQKHSLSSNCQPAVVIFWEQGILIDNTIGEILFKGKRYHIQYPKES